MSTFSGWPGRREFRGKDQFYDFLAEWTEPYEEWMYEVEQILDAGEGRVVAVLHQRGKPRGSDSWVQLRYAIVYAIAGGLIQRAQAYASPADALVAAGLDD
jgi:ketosteroid isomerase-like protein